MGQAKSSQAVKLNESKPSALLYAVGGNFDPRSKSSEEAFIISRMDPKTKRWSEYSRLPVAWIFTSSAVIGRKIYTVGGVMDSSGVTARGAVWDTETGKGNALPEMQHGRRDCGIAVLNGDLYVAGGFIDGGNEAFTSVERFSVADNRWYSVAPMIQKRGGLKLVELKGYLYAIGGIFSPPPVKMERYDPRTDRWEQLNGPHEPYYWFGAAVYKNRIYVANFFGFEIYNPETDQWHKIANCPDNFGMTIQLAAYDDKLYAIGGVPGAHADRSKKTPTAEVYVYDFDTGSWSMSQKLDIPRSFHHLAVVEV